MPRSVSALALLAAVAALAGPAAAGDWNFGTDLRGAYTVEPKDWTEAGDPFDTLKFEAGLRYWYSLGAQSHAVGAQNFTSEDAAHLGEVHLRIDDLQTRTYVKGIAGYSAAINGTYAEPSDISGTVADGRIGYAGADFGWNAFGTDAAGLGGFVGYQYWNDSPRTSRATYATISTVDDVAYSPDTGVWSVGGDSVDNNVDVNMLRLGISGRAQLGDMVDIAAEVAAVPYAHVGGVIGGHALGVEPGSFEGCPVVPPAGCNPVRFKTTPTSFGGWGYGAMGEAWLGFHPSENLTFRLGARAWYLQGTYDATFSMASVTPLYGAPAVAREDYISTANPFSMLRYGVMAEFTYRF